MKIFVANLDYKVTQEEITALFETYGPVHHVHICMIDGRARGFGFVGMQRREGLVAIQELHNLQFHGRAIVVQEALDQRKIQQ